MKKLLFIFIIFLIFCSKQSTENNVECYSFSFLEHLLALAKEAIIDHLENPTVFNFQEINYTDKERGLFIRIIKNGQERGCIGFLRGVSNLGEAAQIAAINAAFFDSRFAPLKKNELKNLELEITVIGKFIPLDDPYDFVLGQHSLLYNDHSHRGFLQAQIALEKGYSKYEFLSALCKKAGLHLEAYKKKNAPLFKADTISLKLSLTEINNKK